MTDQLPTLAFHNRQTKTIDFCFEPLGYGWEMEPDSTFELVLNEPVAGDPSLSIVLEDDVILVFEEKTRVLVVKKNGEVILET